ncbi:MAG: hypothetical protein HY071_06885 [Chloroflexi bacterium]|nr:hypothetical protein [Chloroflexota bacterium]
MVGDDIAQDIDEADELTGGTRVGPRTALDIRAEHRILHRLSEEALRSIPLLREGTHLRKYERYLDLHDPARGGFVASGDEVLRPGQRVVAKDSVPTELWDDLMLACDEITHLRRQRSA